MNIPLLSLGLWLFLNSSIAKHSLEEHWLSLEACSTLMEKDDPDLLLCINSLSSHLWSSFQFPSGHLWPCADGVWLCQSSSSCRSVALQPWQTAAQSGRTNLAQSLALLLCFPWPHIMSHTPHCPCLHGESETRGWLERALGLTCSKSHLCSYMQCKAVVLGL